MIQESGVKLDLSQACLTNVASHLLNISLKETKEKNHDDDVKTNLIVHFFTRKKDYQGEFEKKLYSKFSQNICTQTVTI